MGNTPATEIKLLFVSFVKYANPCGSRHDGCLIFVIIIVHCFQASVKYRPFFLFAHFLFQGGEDEDSDDEPESVYEPSGSAEEEESSQEEYSSETETSEDGSGENRISALTLN